MEQPDFGIPLDEAIDDMLSDPAFGSRKGSGVYGKGREKIRAILFEAINLLGTEGVAGFSMRRVADRLGVKASVIQHYYPSRDELMGAMGLFFAHIYKREHAKVLGRTYASPEARLEAYLDFALDRSSGPHLLFSLLSEGQTGSPAMAEALRVIYELDLTCIGALLEPLTPGLTNQERKARAAFLAASMDGLEIFLGKGPALTPQVPGLRKHSRKYLMAIALAD